MELEAQLKQSAARLKNFGQGGDSTIPELPKTPIGELLKKKFKKAGGKMKGTGEAIIGGVKGAGEKAKEASKKFTKLDLLKFKKTPKPPKPEKPPKKAKEIPEFEAKSVEYLYTGESTELTQAREKYVNTYQKEVFERYHNKSKIGKALTKLPFSQPYKEEKWSGELADAKKQYEEELVNYGQQLISEGRETANVFEQLVIDEEKYLQHARLAGYPEKEKGVIEKALNTALKKWRELPAWQRMTTSFAIGAGGFVLGAAIGPGIATLSTAAITTWTVRRLLSVSSPFVSAPIAGFLSRRGSEKRGDKKEETKKEIIEGLKTSSNFSEAIKDYQKAKTELDKKEKRGKLLTLGGVSAFNLAVGAGSYIFLSDLFGQAPALASDLPKTSTVETATSTSVHRQGFWERIFPDKGKISADQEYISKKLPADKLNTAVQKKIEDFENKRIISQKEVNELVKLAKDQDLTTNDVDRITLYSFKNKTELDQFLKEKHPSINPSDFKFEEETIKGTISGEPSYTIDKETGALFNKNRGLLLPGADGDIIEGLQRKPTSEEIERILKMRQDLGGELPNEVKTKIVEEIDLTGGLDEDEANKIVSDFSAKPAVSAPVESLSTPSSTIAPEKYAITVKSGGSVWKSAKQTLLNIYGGDFDNLPVDKQNVFIDWIKDRVAEKPVSFDLTGDINKIKIGQVINFKAIFEDQNSVMLKHFNEVLKDAGKLTAQEINKKLRHEWF